MDLAQVECLRFERDADEVAKAPDRAIGRHLGILRKISNDKSKFGGSTVLACGCRRRRFDKIPNPKSLLCLLSAQHRKPSFQFRLDI